MVAEANLQNGAVQSFKCAGHESYTLEEGQRVSPVGHVLAHLLWKVITDHTKVRGRQFFSWELLIARS